MNGKIIGVREQGVRPWTDMELRVALAIRKWIDETGRYGGGLLDGQGIAGVEIKGCVPLAQIAAVAIRAMREPTNAQYEALAATDMHWVDLSSDEVWKTYIDAASPPLTPPKT